MGVGRGGVCCTVNWSGAFLLCFSDLFSVYIQKSKQKDNWNTATPHGPFLVLGYSPESPERFIEDHAFSRSSDLAPRPPLPPSHTRKEKKKDNLLRGEAGEGEEPNHTAAWKPAHLQYLSFSTLCSSPSPILVNGEGKGRGWGGGSHIGRWVHDRSLLSILLLR